MDLKKLAAKAKKTIDDRGGVESLKGDAAELRNIAKGDGSLSDKAKRAAKAVKDPGAGKDIPARDEANVPEGEMKPAAGAGRPEDTPRKGGAPHQ
jgi:hypothetical protein